MKKIDRNAFLVKLTLDEKLYEISEHFYYSLEKVREPREYFKINIGNRLLESKFPLIFPKNNPFCKSSVNRGETKTSSIQRFDLFCGENPEGYIYPKVGFPAQMRVIPLTEEVAGILNPFGDLKIINVKKEIRYGVLPYVAHVFDDEKHIYSRIQLDWDRGDNIGKSDFLINLNIFYEFFRDIE